MKKYVILIVGFIMLIGSFVWMVLSKSSTGLFLILGAISGALIVEGIHRVRKEKG